jgi:hypothetical protein
MFSVGIVVLLLILIILCLTVVMTWTTYPLAKYVMISRADGENRFIAVGGIEAYTPHGQRIEFVGLEGAGIETTGTYDTSSTSIIPFDGKKNLYFTYDGTNKIGPSIAGINNTNASTGYIIFPFSCPSRVAKISIHATENDLAKHNLQRIKIMLLDQDRNPIINSEKITPTLAMARTVHHILYV